MTTLLRLNKAIAQAGIASRRKADILITEGKVSVNGKTVTQLGTVVDFDKDIIQVCGKYVSTSEKKYYFLLNKPAGFITSLDDPHHNKTVMQFVPKIKGLFPVGRLDKDTTGLLLITNDGDLAFKLTHPSFGIKKTYVAVVDGIVIADEIQKLEKGVFFDEKVSSPCKVAVVKQNTDSTVVEITIHEGRKRQVKRMFEVIGHKVRKLERTQYAGLKINMKIGDYRELTQQEVEKLYKSTQMAAD